MPAHRDRPNWIQRYTATDSPASPRGSRRRPSASRSSATEAGPGRPGPTTWRTDTWRQASDEPVGVETHVDAAGRADRLVARPDRRRARPPGGGALRWGRTARPSFPTLPEGWLMGLSFAAGRTALGARGRRRLPDLRRRAGRHDARARRRSSGPPASGRMGPGTRRRSLGRRLARCASRTASTATSCTTRCVYSTPRPAPWSATSRTRAATWRPPSGRPIERPAARSRANAAPSSDRRSGTRAPGDVATSPSTCRERSSRCDRFADGSPARTSRVRGRGQLLRLDRGRRLRGAHRRSSAISTTAAIRPDGDVWYRLQRRRRRPPATRDAAGDGRGRAQPRPSPHRPVGPTRAGSRRTRTATASTCSLPRRRRAARSRPC